MHSFRAPLAVALCLGLLVPAQAADQPASKARQPYQSGQLQGDARILHALNRFTFGPRPGDLEVVRAIGLEKWFDQQLHPSSLDLSDLNARLAQFPAMQWSTADLLYRLPSNAVIRQAINGKVPIPERGALHAVYVNQMARVALKQEQKKQSSLDHHEPSIAPAVDAAQPAPSVDQAAINSLLALAPAQRLARLTATSQPELDSLIKSLKPAQRASLDTGLTPDQHELLAALENPQRLVDEELIAQRLTRDIYSTAQLQEVMTDFWLNHFNVFLHKNETTPYYLISFERDAIRPYALGKFEDLLESTAHSPAMLMYLDNAESTGPDSSAAERAGFSAARNPNKKPKARQGLNENYARELMELHTLGVNGGYTQADVTEVARILTGWTIDRPQRGGSFQFDPNRHQPGTKKVLHQKFKDQGELEGRLLLHFLATRPATAQFLSHKLAVRFLSDDPPQPLVDRMAQTYLSTGGDIAAVLKTLFHSPEFWSTSAYRAKVKTPIEYVLSAVRSANANIDNLRPLANALRAMGMPLYACVPPTGYTWQSSAWVSTGALVDRINFALALAASRLPGISVAWNLPPGSTANSVLALDSPSAEAEESRLESLIVSGGVSDATRSAVLQQFQQQFAADNATARPMPVARAAASSALERQDQLLAGLLLGSPEFQRR